MASQHFFYCLFFDILEVIPEVYYTFHELLFKELDFEYE